MVLTLQHEVLLKMIVRLAGGGRAAEFFRLLETSGFTQNRLTSLLKELEQRHFLKVVWGKEICPTPAGCRLAADLFSWDLQEALGA